MKRLLLLRHAKAEQGGKDDHTRTLTARGHRDAARMGAFLHEHGDVPDLVLCSTSARTRETWQKVSDELGGASKIEFLKSLYLAPAKAVSAIVQKADDAARTVLVIAHSPGTEETAVALARASSDKEERARIEAIKEKFPTAALAVLDFDAAHWRDVKPGRGILAAFVRPKDLGD